MLCSDSLQIAVGGEPVRGQLFWIFVFKQLDLEIAVLDIIIKSAPGAGSREIFAYGLSQNMGHIIIGMDKVDWGFTQ